MGQGSMEMAAGEGRRPRPLAVTGAVALAASAAAFLLASPPSSGAAPDGVPGDEPTWPQVISLPPDDAYVDRESGQPLGSPKVAVAGGSVDGSPWSLVTYLAASDPDAEGVAAELVRPTPCVQVFLGTGGEHGGGGACLSPASPMGGGLEAVGIGWGDTSTVAYLGVVDDSVLGVEFAIAGEAAPRPAELFGTSQVPGSRVFVFFVPVGIGGAMVVEDVGGRAAEIPLCLTDPVLTEGSVVGCRMSPA